MQILITRPAEQAHETAAALSILGYEALLSPVVEVAPTDKPWPHGTIDLVVATSARAFEALLTEPDFPTPEDAPADAALCRRREDAVRPRVLRASPVLL